MSRPASHRTRTDHRLRDIGPAAAVAPGDVLADRYVIRSELGRGAVGQVFRAYDRATKSTVALKVVQAGLGGQRNALDRFGREVRHARAVQHPNVCRVFELQESDGFTFFTMELARESLRATFENGARRPIAERMADARAVTAGLEAIHAAGIIHGDLKPENLLRMADGRLVVSDFGLARCHGNRTGGRAGTRGYLAPEMRKGRAPSRRSDVWSLGVVLREILLGGRPADRSPRGTPIEAALAELCRACTAIAPAGRPTARRVLERLDESDGETLRERLRRDRVPTREALTLGAQVLEALVDVHRSGEIHGAITPANIFLSRRAGAVRLLRPGRDQLASAEVPPAYLAPEQARRERGVDGRADVFAVGCVLLECLTGHPPDGGRAANTVMARRSLGQGLEVAASGAEPAVRPVLRRMLAATRAQRAADAGALARELANLAETIRARRARTRSSPAMLDGEQCVGSVLAVRAQGRAIPAQALAAAESFGATVRKIAADSFSAVMHGGGTPSDLAARAAGCAVALKATLPAASFAIGTGRLRMDADGPSGDAAERTLRLFDDAPDGDILLDATSATLLSSRFRIREGKPLALLGERSLVDRPRTVLGREIPCIGRDRELGTLISLWQECTAEPVARTVLITAPAGTGKSRVRHELVDRIQRDGERFELLIGRGDALRAGAPFAMIAPALRAAAGLVGGEPSAIARKRLLAHVSRHVAAEKAARVAAFVGEIADVPFPDDDLPALRAARQDPRLMADQTLAAWLDLLDAQCSAHPVLLVLEDLHWGDAPSVQLIDAALRTLRERPLMVLAVARPEIDDKFPNLWIERDPQRISLPPLTPRSAQKLVLAAAGDMSVEQVSSIVERADGNPLYLEELVRAVGVGTGTRALPETVIGTVQARFDALGPDARRVLRAAAVFGQTLRAGGVKQLLGGAQDRSLDQWLDLLVEKEVLFSRHAGDDQELVFRHALLQEAAYGMLTAEDRVLGHRLAGDYLEATGERDAILLVEHYERGEERLKAAHWCRLAAEQALDANDLSAVIERVARGVRLGAEGEVLGAMRLVEAQARFWRGEYGQAEAAARQSVATISDDLQPAAVAELIAALGQQAKFTAIADICRNWSLVDGAAELRGSWLGCLVRATGSLLAGSRYDLAEALLRRIQTEYSSLSPAQRARLQGVQGLLHVHRGAQSRAFEEYRAALRAFESLGDKRSAIEMQLNLGGVMCDLGVLEDADELLSSAIEAAERMDLRSVLPSTLSNLTLVRANLGRFGAARAAGERARLMAQEQGDRRIEGVASLYLTIAASLAGAPLEAEAHARRALAALAQIRALRPTALAGVARALLAQGRDAEAMDSARAAYDELVTLGGVEDGEASIYVVYAECLLHDGQRKQARDLLARALTRLEERWQAIDIPAWRGAFLTRLPDNARTLELARTVGVSSALLDAPS